MLSAGGHADHLVALGIEGDHADVRPVARVAGPACWVALPGAGVERMPSRHSARPSTGRSSPPEALTTSMPHAPGPPRSCAGTTSKIATAASATSLRRSGARAKIMPSWRLNTRLTTRPAGANRPGGLVAHATAHPLVRSPSIPSANASLALHWIHPKYSR